MAMGSFMSGGDFHLEMKGVSNRPSVEKTKLKGDFHLEMKGISNKGVSQYLSMLGDFHLEMKGISNLGVTLTMVLRWWLSSQIRVFYANS